LTAKFLKLKMPIPAQNFFAFSDGKIYAIVPGIFSGIVLGRYRVLPCFPMPSANARIVE